ELALRGTSKTWKIANEAMEDSHRTMGITSDDIEYLGNAIQTLTRSLEAFREDMDRARNSADLFGTDMRDASTVASDAIDEYWVSTLKVEESQRTFNQTGEEVEMFGLQLGRLDDIATRVERAADRLTGTTDEFADELEQADDAVEELNQELDGTAEYAFSVEDAFNRTHTTINNYAVATESAADATDHLDDEIDQLEHTAEQLDSSTTDAAQAADKLDDELESVGKTANRAESDIEKMADSLDHAGNEMEGMSFLTEALAEGVGGFLTDVFEEGLEVVWEFTQESVEAFQDFDKGFREVMTLLPGESAEFRAELEDDAKALAVELGRLPEEVLPSIYNALSAGVPPDNVIDAVRVSSDAARAGVADLEGTLTLGLGTMNAQVKGVDSLSDVYDQLFFTVKNGVITLPEMNGMMSEVTSIAGEAGVSMQDISAALITMTRQGDSAAEAGELLTITLTQLATAGTTMSNTFEAAASTSFRNFMAEGHTLGEAMQLLQEHADNTGEALGDILGGGSPFFRDTQAARGALELTGRNLNTLVEFSERAEEAIGSMSGAAAEMGESAALNSEKAAASWEIMKVSIGEQLKPLSDAFYQAKTAVADYLTTDLETKDVADEFAAATENMNLSLTQQYRYLGAVTGGTSFLRDTWDDAETIASRYGVAIDILNQGFDGSRSELEALIEEQLALNDQATVSAEQTEQLTNSFMEQALALDTSKTAIEEQAIAEEELLFQKQMTTEGVLDATNQVIDATTAEKDANDALFKSASEGNAEILADSEQVAAVAEERAAAIAEAAAAEQEAINATRESYNRYALGALESGEATTNWTNELFKSAAQQPINQYQLVALAAATGEYTDAQIEAMLREAAMRVAVEELSVALANGQITVQESINRMKDFEAQLDGDYTAQFDYSDIEAGTAAADDLKASLEAAEGEYHAEFVTRNTTINTTINQTFDRGTNPSGDPNQAMSAGGVVRGGIPGQDSVHTVLMPGEVVIPNDIVNKYGEDFFMSYVNGAEPNSDLELVPGFPMTENEFAGPDVTITIPIQIYGDPDRALIDEFKQETKTIVADALQDAGLRANGRIRMRG
ncbi:MAG: phage tail tape measure protein, partial [Anaerolineales bacterium]|nr:phage tail tape measure protein [Anaerolineales bacterium]